MCVCDTDRDGGVVGERRREREREAGEVEVGEGSTRRRLFFQSSCTATY